MNTHFTSGGYLHIKTPKRSLMLPSDKVEATAQEMRQRAARLIEQAETIELYMEGKTTSHPDALR